MIIAFFENKLFMGFVLKIGVCFPSQGVELLKDRAINIET